MQDAWLDELDLADVNSRAILFGATETIRRLLAYAPYIMLYTRRGEQSTSGTIRRCTPQDTGCGHRVPAKPAPVRLRIAGNMCAAHHALTDMFRLFCSLLCASLLPFGAGAEVICALGSGVSSYDPKADQRPASDAMQLAGRMNAALAPTCLPRCPEIAIFRNTTAPNAMLVVTAEQAKFVYAPQFFATVYNNYGDGAIIAIIAHEYGHALDEVHPAGWMKSEWSRELRADAWAGCALAKNHLSSSDLAGALTAVAKYPPSHDANWSLRVPALRLGYVHCGGDGAKFDGAAGASRRR